MESQGAKILDSGKTSDQNTNNSSKGATKKKEWAKLISAILFDSFVIIFTFIFIYWSFNAAGVILFAWHPALLSLGFVCFMTAAFVVYSDLSLLGRFVKSYSNRVFIHWILQAIGFVCIFLGTVAIVANKFLKGSHHLKSYHSIFGLIAVIFCILSIIGGTFAKYSVKFMKTIRPVKLKIYHSLFGILTYILGGIALILSLYSNWFRRNWSEEEKNFAICGIVIIWAYAMMNPLIVAYQRLNRLFDSR